MCLIVEGYTDVMAMHQSGVENVVASSGTALTPGQIALIRRFTKNVTVLFDGDAAGMRASLRGIDLLLEEGMKVKVVNFPNGDDPDSYSKKVSSTELQKFVKEDAQDILAFKADLLSVEAGDDPIKKAEMVQSLIDTISCIPDPIQQSVYVQTVAARLNLQEGLLVSEVAKKVARKAAKTKIGGRNVQAPQYEEPPIPLAPIYNAEPLRSNRQERRILEDNLVRLLLEHGESMVTVEVEANEDETTNLDVTFAELLLHRVEEFGLNIEDESSRYIIAQYTESIGNGELPSTESFFSGTTEDVQQKAANMLVNRYSLSENWEHKHHIFSTKEEDVLEQALSASTNRILLHDTLKTIDAVLEAMEEQGITSEEVNRLLTEKMELDKKVGKLSADLNIIILPK